MGFHGNYGGNFLAVPSFASYVNMPFRMDSLLVGGLIAAALRNTNIATIMLKNRSSLFAALAVCVLMMAVLTLNRSAGKMEYTLFAIFYGLLLLFCVLYQNSAWTMIFRHRLLCFFGSIAFGVYMYHQAINGLYHGAVRGQPPSLESTEGVILTLSASLTTLAVSYVSFHWYEKPFVRYGRRFVYGPVKTQTTVCV